MSEQQLGYTIQSKSPREVRGCHVTIEVIDDVSGLEALTILFATGSDDKPVSPAVALARKAVQAIKDEYPTDLRQGNLPRWEDCPPKCKDCRELTGAKMARQTCENILAEVDRLDREARGDD